LERIEFNFFEKIKITRMNNCQYCNKFFVICGQHCEECKSKVCEECSKRICNKCSKYSKTELPKRYWVVGYKSSDIRGGFEDVIFTTDNITDARVLGTQGKLNCYIYDIYLQDYVD